MDDLHDISTASYGYRTRRFLKDNYGMTAVKLAASKRQNAMVSLFKSKFGVDQEAKDNNETRAPELAAYNRQNATVRQIDKHDADVVFMGMFKKKRRGTVSNTGTT